MMASRDWQRERERGYVSVCLSLYVHTTIETRNIHYHTTHMYVYAVNSLVQYVHKQLTQGSRLRETAQSRIMHNYMQCKRLVLMLYTAPI